MRNRVVLAAVIVVSALAVTSTATAVPPPAPPGAPRAASATTGGAVVGAAGARALARIRFGRCRDRSLRRAGVRCGFLRVPLDYARPAGPQVKIAVSRLRHRSRPGRYQGVMLVNPGGPGGSGLGFSQLGRAMPGGSGRFYDWIGFDPRGVGASRPSLSCMPSYFRAPRPPYRPSSRAILHRWLARAQRYANACERAAPRLLPHMRTTDVARDVNRIRLALGARRINYYGYSYGTYLGQVYATLFPRNVRRMVLDSNVDPRFVGYRANLKQNVAFDRVAQHWFAWVADHRARYHLGRTRAAVERQYYRAQRRLRAHPAGGRVGSSEWSDTFLTIGYAQVVWPHFTRRFADWVHQHNVKRLVRFYRNQHFVAGEPGFAVYNAVGCTDSPWPHRWRKWGRDNRRVNRRAPFDTWANAWFNAACRVWPARAGHKVHVRGHRVRPLLLGETLDGATPFSGSLEVRHRFRRSRLVATVGGTTHAASPDLSPRCVNRRLGAYLRSGRLPARKPGRRADVRCQARPEPLS